MEQDVMDMRKMYNRGIIHKGNPYRMLRVMRKALSGEAISVGFIGGSITQGSLASSSETCYAYLVYLWWKNRFPMSEVVFINAGVGATIMAGYIMIYLSP